jgi:CheY-like chemotaxis protein
MAKRILVVDDNIANLKLACDVCEWEGYVVDRAVHAEAALESIERKPPDLILMDLALPGMDGLELTRLLRGREDTCGIPILALTAFAMKVDEERALEAGCDAFLAKPIDTRMMPALLAGMLSRRHLPGPAMPEAALPLP